ncbi:MAG TPA: hypothetical protein VF491_23125 [Vicinamibacterales bacterium]|jgi:hypothetical protein
MKIAIAFAVALGVSAGISAVSAQERGDEKKYEKGATVTLQGCVVEAESKKDTYVMTNVREWPIAESDIGKYGKRYYWIDKAGKDMKAHLGHTIQVVGKISDIEKSEIEFKKGDNAGGMNVEIEGPGKNVVTTPANADLKMNSRPNKSDMPITLLKLKVEEIKMTAATCSATN